MTARMIMKLRVEQARLTSPDVLHLDLAHPLRPELPEWTAGAHVDVRMSDGKVRQYSLCGDPEDRSRYRIAVKREVAGRGSAWVHENLQEGAIAHVSAPRNNLPLGGAKRTVMIAGGIGITPFASMAYTLSRENRDFVFTIAPDPRRKRRCCRRSRKSAEIACNAGSPRKTTASIRR
jgi:ferredoxin-NADP reductase